MSAKAAAIFLGLLVVCCGPSRRVIPLLGDFEVMIGSPPELLLDQAHPVPRGNARRERRMLELFDQVGCQQLEQRRRHRSLPHVICTLPGESPSTILVTAHFDEPPSRQHIDNWAGAAMLPSLYRSLAVAPRLHTYAFVAFVEQGAGYVGSPTTPLHVLERLPPDEREPIVALVSLLGLGLDVSSVWDPVADPDLRVDLHSVSLSLELPVRRLAFVGQGSRVPSDVPSILIGVADRQIGEYLDSFRLLAVYLSYLDQTLELRRRLRETEKSPDLSASAPEPLG